MASHGDYGGPQGAAAADGVQIKRSVTGTIKTGVGSSQFYSKHGITLHEINQPVPDRDSLDHSRPSGDPRRPSDPWAPDSRVSTDLKGSSECRGGADHRRNSESRGGADHRRTASSSSTVSTRSIVIKRMSGLSDHGTKFPKLEECAHFHYDFVELGHIQLSLSDENQENIFNHVSDSSPPQPHFHIHVASRDKSWTVRRTYENLRGFDRQLHRCIFDRKFSSLPELRRNELTEEGIQAMKKLLKLYLQRFSSIAGNMINCGPILSWMEMDNRGHRLIVSDDSAINTPAVGAAHVVKRYTSQAPDEISFEVGNMVSIIDMPPGGESVWWRGKKGFEVGFFPAECVEMIGDKLSQAMESKLPERPKPVLRKRGKLISLLRNFFSSRPARTQLKRTGIVKERVFGCDLGEHLLNLERQIPLVLECCTHTIETHGLVDGIYRLSGVASNIQKLRNEFDEDKQPNLTDECYLQDIHSISSLLKAYFRDLPNPLFTFQLYDKFIAAIQDEENKLVKIHDVIQQLPPPHYRTAKYLMEHLNRVAQHGRETGMHCKNLAIVWAPNLLRSKDLEMACSTAALQGVGVQAIVTEFLISHAELIFSDQLQNLGAGATQGDSLRRSRPKSLALCTPTKLLSLEEAQAMVNPSTSPKQKFIEVGGGPSSLPDKYHTVIDLPGKKKSRKDRKSPVTGWRAIFSKKSQNSGKERHSDSITSVEDYRDEEDGTRSQRLRAVRSADSLLTEPSRPTSNNRYSDISDSSTFINPYTDEFSGVRPIVTSLDRVKKGKATKRSISADNSYSESELETVVDMSPLDDATLSRRSQAGDSPQSSLLSELEVMLQARSVSISPGDLVQSQMADCRGSVLTTSESQSLNSIRPKSVTPVDIEMNQQPMMPKRSKSTALDQTSHSSFDLPPLPPRHQKSQEHHATIQSNKVPISSPGKRKKAKAPLPPVAPPRKHTITENEDGNVQRTPQRSSERKARSIEDLVTLELTESPGARRKLLYSAPCELETQGTEGAPGEMAPYETNLTDDEAFNTQNLSLTTDSENEVERREGLSHMDGVQDTMNPDDLAGDNSEDLQDVLTHLEMAGEEGGNEAGVEPSQVPHSALSPKTGHAHLASDPEITLNIEHGDYIYSQTSADSSCLDDSGMMSKSLNSILTGAADTYYSSDEMVSRDISASGMLYTDLADSNSDSHVSGATMSTNFTSSSDLPCAASTSDESDVTSAQIYAESLRNSSSNVLRRSLVPYSTSDSDVSYSREISTPQVELSPDYTLSASDTDTEIVKTPDDGYADGMESSDRMTPNIDLSDTEVLFVDPYVKQELRTKDEPTERPDVLPGLSLNSELLLRTAEEISPLRCEHSTLVIRTSLESRQEGATLHAQSTRVPTPKRQLASAPTTPDKKDMDSAEHAGSAEPIVLAPQCADGYLADRSNSASPTFLGVHGKPQNGMFVQHQEVSGPEINHREVIKEPSVSPLDSNASMTRSKDLKKSADSLLFEMDDLESNLRGSVRSSMDKLNLSSEYDEVFFRPDSMENIRTETNMSISPENYLEDAYNRKEKSAEKQSLDVQPTTEQKPEVTVEYQVRSAAALDRKKVGTELSRKKSVRELMSRFESSTPSESSDDAANAPTLKDTTEFEKCSSLAAQDETKSNAGALVSDTDVPTKLTTPVSTGPSVSLTTQKTPPLSRPRSGTSPGRLTQPQSGTSPGRLTQSQSGTSPGRLTQPHSRTSPRELDRMTRSSDLTELRITESPQTGSSPATLDHGDTRVSDDTDSSSSSPNINDLRRKFETKKKNRAQEGSVRTSIKERNDSTGSFTSALDVSDAESNSSRKSVVERLHSFQTRPRPLLPFQQESSKDGDVTGPHSKRNDVAEVTSRNSRSSLSERLQTLSNRFKNYEDEPIVTEEVRSDLDSKTNPQRRSDVSKEPSGTKGQFVQRYSHRDKSEALDGAAGSENEPATFGAHQGAAQGPTVADDSLTTSLFERRKKFESFGPADNVGSDNSDRHVAICGSAPSQEIPSDNPKDLVTKAKQFGSRPVILQPNKNMASLPKDIKPVGALEQETTEAPAIKQDIKAATLPRDSSKASGDFNVRRRKAPEDDRPVSVRDLSKQFERQLSEKSDSSRTSSSSLRGSGLNFAHDVANGNTPPVITACEDVHLTANINVTQQTWTTIL